jgi:hypothetical protein
MRRKAARAILSETGDQFAQPSKLIAFGSERRVSDRCTLYDAPARFDQCLGCAYRRGAQGLGILCGHRFGIDPTYIDGVLTQIRDDGIENI